MQTQYKSTLKLKRKTELRPKALNKAAHMNTATQRYHTHKQQKLSLQSRHVGRIMTEEGRGNVTVRKRGTETEQEITRIKKGVRQWQTEREGELNRQRWVGMDRVGRR